ncbi:type III-D CRISPR-associated protein Csx19 [Schwartzia succinivorans]|jgi:CRISPR-associated protein (TIGR03984 family)|uniref:CRISPR-associated protein, TIGR03984 family n=1 Tax=Schwartzia succinivorans DSM 10502 TaxID=1123243 RepID=A0A1M4ZAV8_9FIRM|nr:CRISPR-associated protein Csx19 [Schwartzia succinivorans]SHF14902.1 CRISPR-associated protein, TIGR03984 family [Schwartzia succinivorans DSM 10502]
MGMELTMSELSLVHGTSETKPLNVSSDLASVQKLLQDTMQADGIAVMWKRSAIVWGRYVNGRLELSAADGDKSCEELRVFNGQEEVHLRKKGSGLSGRYRKDGSGDEAVYVDSFSRFWGEKAGEGDGYILLRDKQRKLSMNIPAPGDGKSEKYGLTTRNYITADNPVGLAGYTDYRFVEISAAEVK